MGRGVKTPPNKYSTVGIALNTTWTISPEICKKVYSSYHRSQRTFRTVLKLYVGYFYHIFLFYKRKNLTWADRFLAFGKLFVEKFSFSIISQFFPDPPPLPTPTAVCQIWPHTTPPLHTAVFTGLNQIIHAQGMGGGWPFEVWRLSAG